MTRVRFLDHIRAVLTEAVLAGAGRVLRVRREALSAGANILMVVFGGQDVYANLGAGNELDIAPGQVIAQEAGLAVRTSSRRVPVWDVWKQPVIVAPSARIAARVLRIAGVQRTSIERQPLKTLEPKNSHELSASC